MNLIKSFNFKFLKQNIKKSKGTIILSLIIVPLFFSMYLVVSGLEMNKPYTASVEILASMDLFFMYIIPFIYSVVLFGFVFKKPSTDFMNSMPINRKTMFVTNTIGGIGLITIIQLLSGFVALLWGAIFKNIIVFPTALLDIMFISWLSYIFVFVASNFAMSFSGTKQTQFIAAVLILFFIPICLELVNEIRTYKAYNYSYYTDVDVRENYDLSIANGYQTTYFDTLEKINNYTMPFKIMRYGLSFSFETNLRMIILSILYFVLGLKIYQKKKMEYSEESFGSQKLHMIVKSLTLIPILLLVDRLSVYDDEAITPIVITIILCAIYYFIFDIITKRKVPIKTTIVTFAGTVFVVQAMATFIGNMNSKNLDIDAEDIKYISLGRNSKSSSSYSSYYWDINENSFDGDYFIKNKQILNLILDGRNKISHPGEYDLDYDYYNSYISPNKDIYFNIKLKNGKEYYVRTTIPTKNYDEILTVLSKDEDYVEHMRKNILGANGILKVGDDIVNNKTKKKIEKTIKENIEDINVLALKKDSINYITKIVYKNHKIVEYKIPVNINDELTSIVSDFTNKQALENIKGYKYGINVQVYNKNEYIKTFYDNEDILDFIENHASDEFDPSKKYYILNGGLETRKGYKNFTFYTNSTKEIDKIMDGKDMIKYR